MATSAAFNLDPVFDAAAQEWNLDPNLLRAVAGQESGGTANPDRAVSSAGAQGRMQIMPGTARDLGVTDPSDPVQSIYGGAKYLSAQLDKYGSPELALAAYNAGPGRVDDYLAGKAPLPAETVAYIPGVTRRYQMLATPQATPAPATVATPDLDQAIANLRTGQAQNNAPPPPPAAADPFSMAWQASQAASGAPGTSALPAGRPAPPSATSTQASDPFTAAWQAAQAASPPAAAPGVPAAAASAPASAQPPIQPQAGTGVMGRIENFAEGAGHAVLDASHGLYSLLNRADQAVPSLNGINQAVGMNPQAALTNLDAENAQYQRSGVGDTLAGQAGGLLGQTALALPVLGPLGAAATATGRAAVAGADALSPALGRGAGVINNLLTGTATSSNTLARPFVRGTSLAANGAVQGGAVNLLTGDPDQGVGQNLLVGAGTGAILGPVGAGAIAAVRGGYNAAKGLVQPFTEAGRNAIADNALARLAVGGPLTINDNEMVRNSVPTLAQATGNPGLAGAERAVAAVRPNTFTARAADNNDARTALVDSLRGTPTDIEAAETTRDATAVPAITGPLNASATPANARAAVDAIDQILASPAGQRDAVQSALGNIRSKLVTPVPLDSRVNTALGSVNQAIVNSPSGVDPGLWSAREALVAAQGQPAAQQAAVLARLKAATSPDPAAQAVIDGAASTIGTASRLESDPAQLYGIRKAIGDALSPLSANAGSDAQLASSELQQVKVHLDNAIEGAAPGFKQGLADYADSSRPIDAMRYLQSKGFTSADGTVTLAKVKGVLDDIAKQQALPGPRNAKSLPPATLNSLQALYADLLRQNNSRLGMQPGSNTFQNLATSNALGGLGAPIAWTANALSRIPVAGNLLTGGIASAYRAQNEPILEAVVNKLANPLAGASVTRAAQDLSRRARVVNGLNPLLITPGVQALNARLSPPVTDRTP